MSMRPRFALARRPSNAWPLRLAFALAALAWLSACGDETPAPADTDTPFTTAEWLSRTRVAWPEAERAAAIEAGTAAIARAECNRCHAIDELPPSSRPTHCVSCHVWIKGLRPGHRHHTMLTERYGAETLARYQRNIEHFQRVPDLSGVATRLRPAWIDEYLAAPHDLRPAMEETMPRLQLPEADRRAIVRYFAAVAGRADPYADTSAGEAARPRPRPARLAEGAALFRTKTCNTCHTFGNRETGVDAERLHQMGMPARMAPNLRFTRERMDRDAIIAWIMNPAEVLPGTLMPTLGVTFEDAAKLADFILYANPRLNEAPEPDAGPLPPILERPVSWAEVKENVLGRVCVHCHMNEHERDQGPGNIGGFTWPGDGLAMRTYEFLVRGAREGDGRHSVLVPENGGPAPIVAAMMRRRAEVGRDLIAPFDDHALPPVSAEPPGMPMALPPMDDEAISLLRTWIAQGCPGPTEVTGMPGIDDGFLVPDGPITPNRGCEARPPSEARPAWSTAEPPEWARPRDE